jgi:prophage regulatory protein
MARITIERARTLADRWKVQCEDQERQPSAAYYRNASPHDLIKMLETGKGMDGKKLNSWEFGCLVERWCECFGDVPPLDDAGADPVAVALPSEPMPAADTMLREKEVVRRTGISASTIKRMVADGRFPRPMRIGERAKGWPMRDVQEWIERLDEQRKRPRQ